MFRPVRNSNSRATRPARRIAIEPLEDRTAPAFVSAPTFPVGPNAGDRSEPVAIATGDFNRDGKMDVVTANKGAQGISLLKGKGNGSFAASANVFLGRTPAGITAADLNGDGKLDVVTANKDVDTVSVLLGRGDGTFRGAVTYAAGNGPVAVAVGNVNGDQYVDLAVADTDGSVVTLLLGSGLGKFTVGGSVSVGANPTSVALADFNHDGKPDIASVSGGFGHLNVNLNNGNGTFAAAVNYMTGFCANTVVVGHFNQDDHPDLAVACTFPSGDGVSVLLGNADGTFQGFTNYDVGGQNPLTLALADLDGDGFQAIVTANEQFANNSVSVILGDGAGAFGPARVFTSGQGPLGVAIGDFNSDGVPDVATANANGPIGTVGLLLGNGDGTLVSAPDLVVDGPGPIAATDVTGDGLPDLAVVTSRPGYTGVAIFPGLGDGSFGPRQLTPQVNQATAVAVGDFNGDQMKDLAVSASAGVAILLGAGGGTFGAPTTFAAGPGPAWVTVADLNGDTKADLAVGNGTAPGSANILLGNGDGTFATAVGISAGGPVTYLVARDLNGDGKLDLVAVNGPDNQVSVLYGSGDGTFGVTTSYSTRVGPGSVGVGNFNADSRPDLAIPTFFGFGGSSAVAVLVNNSNGSFTPKTELQTDSRPIGSLVSDFNGDGRLDLAVVNNFADNVCIFPGTGTGTFGKPATYVVGDRPTWVASADFNGDGRPDLAVVNSNSGTVTLLQTPATVAASFRVNIVPTTTTAGKVVQVVVAALDAQGHLLPNYTGFVSFSSNDPKATLPATYKFTAADHGVHRFNVTLRTAGTIDVVAKFGSATGADSITVAPAVANRLELVCPPSTVAGTAFDVTVTARDPFGNADTSYRGTVRFKSSSSPLADLPADYTFVAADNGQKTFTVNLKRAGLRTLIAADTVKTLLRKTVYVNVSAAAVSQFLVSGYPLTTVHNVAHSFTVN